MANYPNRSFPADQNPIGNDFIDVRGTDVVVTNANGHVVITNDGGVALDPVVEAFGRYAHVEVTIGEVIAGNGGGSYAGFGLLNMSGVAAETGGITVEFNGVANQVRIYAWDNAAQFYYSTVNTINLAGDAVGTDVFSLTTTENATADISNYELRQNGSVIDSGTFAHKDNTAQLQPAFNSFSGFGGGAFSHITARDALADTVPAFSSAPSVTLGSNDITFTSNVDATASIIVTSSSASEPSEAAFDASTDTQAVTAGSEATVSVSAAASGETQRVWIEINNVDGRAVSSAYTFTIPANHDTHEITQTLSDTLTATDINGDPIALTAGLILVYPSNVGLSFSANGNPIYTSSFTSASVFIVDMTDGAVGNAATITLVDDVSDRTPDAFSFAAQTDVDTDTVITFAAQTITGIADGTAVSVSGGEVSVNSGAFTSSNTTIDNNQTLAVRLTSSSSADTEVIASVTVGTVTVQASATTASEAQNEYNPIGGFKARDSRLVKVSTTLNEAKTLSEGFDADDIDTVFFVFDDILLNNDIVSSVFVLPDGWEEVSKRSNVSVKDSAEKTYTKCNSVTLSTSLQSGRHHIVNRVTTASGDRLDRGCFITISAAI